MTALHSPPSPPLSTSPSSSHTAIDVVQTIESIYESESRRVYATLVRLLGDLDLAEDALQEAFAAAMKQWPADGVPDNPRAWLVSTGRFKAIDAIRRRSRFDSTLAAIADQFDTVSEDEYLVEEEGISDDRLRLIFTCCHPALAEEARIALTLREVCGLTTEQIAHAFLVPAPTLAQRIVRAKNKIKKAKIPYLVPGPDELADRLESVLQVIYLVFNEGYSASTGDVLTRADLSNEAIRLARLLYALLPKPEVAGLLALMLLHESRREARSTPSGDVVLLEDQDRALWNQERISEGVQIVRQIWTTGEVGPYSIQAAIAAVHAQATQPGQTDWNQIVELYNLLMAVNDSPVIALNRAVAVAMRDDPEAGLALINDIVSHGDLSDYYLLHATIADLNRRLGRYEEARTAYQRALLLTEQEPERRFLDRRLSELPAQTNRSGASTV